MGRHGRFTAIAVQARGYERLQRGSHTPKS